MTERVVRRADFADPNDAAAVVDILDSYASGPMGQGLPLADDVRRQIINGLQSHPAAFALLACVAGRPVGVAVCFEGFSTFAAQPLLNVHDLAVLPDFQQQGLGRQLLDTVVDVARERGCCKVTLEVRDSNQSAKRLYERCGFGPWENVTLFVTRQL